MAGLAVAPEELDTADAPILLAILIACKTGDRLLESVARRELENKHRIKISFGRKQKSSTKVA